METFVERVRRNAVENLNRTTRGYHGAVHGDNAAGQVDVEFPSLLHAATWANVYGMTHHASFRDPKVTLDGSVVLVFSLLTFAEQLEKFVHGRFKVAGSDCE